MDLHEARNPGWSFPVAKAKQEIQRSHVCSKSGLGGKKNVSCEICRWVRGGSSVHVSWLAALGKEASPPPRSLFLGTEARPAQPSYPSAWNVNEPAGETKYDRAAPAQGPGRSGPGGRGSSPCMSIIPGEELFSGVVTSEPHFSSLPFFLFLFFWRRKRSRHGVTKSRCVQAGASPGGRRARLPLEPPGPWRALLGLHLNMSRRGPRLLRNQSPAEGGSWGWDKPPVLVGPAPGARKHPGWRGSPPPLGGSSGGQAMATLPGQVQ